MTSSKINLTAVTDDSTGTDINDPVAKLRHDEAQYLISLASVAVSTTGEITHQIHTHIYKPDGTPAAETQRMLLAALTCMETAEHYLRMLDEVLADVPDSGAPPEADTDDPWAQ